MPVTFQDQVSIEPLRKALDVIIKNVDPEKIILFGSYATGRSDENSDYDLCILVDTHENLRNIAQMLYIELIGCGEAVDLVVQTPSNYEIFKSDKYLIYSEIEKKGIVLYEK